MNGNRGKKSSAGTALSNVNGAMPELPLDLVPDAVLVCDPGTRKVLHANAAAERLFGRTRAELVGQDPGELHPEGSDAAPLALYGGASGTGGDLGPVDTKILTGDGTRLPVRAWATALPCNGQQLPAVFLRYDKERAAQLASLRHSQRRLEMAEQLAHVGHWDWYLEGDDLRWSPETFRIFGCDPEEFRPSVASFEAAIHPEDLPAFIKERERAMEQDGSIRLEHRIVRPDGTVRDVLELADLVRDEDGDLLSVHGTVQDITEQKRAERALRASRARIEERVAGQTRELAALKDVSSAVSKDLRLTEMIWTSLEAIVDTVEADLAMIFLRDGDRMTFQQAHQREGFPPHDSPTCRLIGECLCGLAAQGAPVYSEDVGNDPRCLHTECRNAGITSFTALPLKTDDDVLGVLCVGSAARRGFAEQADFLEALAQDVAIGLQNSMLYEQTRNQARALEREVAARRIAEEQAQRTSNFRQAIIERAAEGLCACHATEEPPYIRFTVWNRRMVAITGYTMAEINRIGWHEAVYPDPAVRSRAIERMDRMRAGDDLVAEEWVLTRKDGEERIVSISTRIIEEGQVLAMLHDLTESRTTETELRRREREFETLVENSPDIILRYDRAHRHLYVSKAVRQISDIPQSTWIGKTHRELGFPDTVCRSWEAIVDRAFEKGRSVREQVAMETPSGPRTLECHLTPEAGSDDGIDSVLTVARDITEEIMAQRARRDAEQELASQRAQSVRSDRLRSLGEMAAGIAHELNQPLGGIRALAEQNLIALQRDWPIDPDEMQKELQMLVDQSDRMSRIIDHVRLFAREAGKPEVQPTDINEVVEGSTGLVREQYRAHGIALVLELAPRLPAVTANPFSLEEVFLNLLSNARHAIEEAHSNGDGVITVRTSLAESKDTPLIQAEVRDNGPGIAAGTLGRLFEPFFTTKDPDKGTGLGLPICRSIVESFDGSITVESPLRGGTIATILLPAGDSREHNP